MSESCEDDSEGSSDECQLRTYYESNNPLVQYVQLDTLHPVANRIGIKVDQAIRMQGCSPEHINLVLFPKSLHKGGTYSRKKFTSPVAQES